MEILGAIMMLVLLAGLGFIIYGFFAFIRALGQSVGSANPATQPRNADAADEIDGMNEGDIHSGPYGYSPNTPYPQTQYGSLFNDDAEWAHEHEE